MLTRTPRLYHLVRHPLLGPHASQGLQAPFIQMQWPTPKLFVPFPVHVHVGARKIAGPVQINQENRAVLQEEEYAHPSSACPRMRRTAATPGLQGGVAH